MSAWTDARIAEMKRLYAEGHSHSQMATRLNAGEFSSLPKVTRNAVLGKCHRLGIADGKRTVSRPVKRPPRLAMPKPRRELDAPAEHDRDDRDLDILTWINRDGVRPNEIASALEMKPAEVVALWREREAQEATGEAA